MLIFRKPNSKRLFLGLFSFSAILLLTLSVYADPPPPVNYNLSVDGLPAAVLETRCVRGRLLQRNDAFVRYSMTLDRDFFPDAGLEIANVRIITFRPGGTGTIIAPSFDNGPTIRRLYSLGIRAFPRGVISESKKVPRGTTQVNFGGDYYINRPGRSSLRRLTFTIADRGGNFISPGLGCPNTEPPTGH